jgi:hypothetical protein
MEYVELDDSSVLEKWPDVRAWKVVGDCCSPEIREGDVVLVSRGEMPIPGRFVVYRRLEAPMPCVGVLDALEDGWRMRGHNLRGGSWRCPVDGLQGVVVHVMRMG